MNEWISSVTNGSIGCASAIVWPSTYSSVADTSSSFSYSRGFAISRYQSQNSP